MVNTLREKKLHQRKALHKQKSILIIITKRKNLQITHNGNREAQKKISKHKINIFKPSF